MPSTVHAMLLLTSQDFPRSCAFHVHFCLKRGMPLAGKSGVQTSADVSIDTSTLPVNHCRQSAAFRLLNRKARATRRKARAARRDGKTASQAEQRQREQCWAHRYCCCLFVGCLTSQQHARVSQGRICSGNFTCCHTEIEVADQTFHLTQSQYTDTRPTSPSTTLYRQAPGRVAT